MTRSAVLRKSPALVLFSCRPEQLRSKVRGAAIFLHHLERLVRQKVAHGRAQPFAIVQQGHCAVPGRGVARPRVEQADGDLVGTRRLVDGETQMVRVRFPDGAGKGLEQQRGGSMMSTAMTRNKRRRKKKKRKKRGGGGG